MTDDAPDKRPTPPGPAQPRKWRVALYLGLTLGLMALFPYISLRPLIVRLLGGLPYAPLIAAGLETLLATLLVLLASLLVIRELARFPLRPTRDALAVVACLGSWYGTRVLIDHYRQSRGLLGPLVSVLFLLACIFAGRLLSLIIRERNLLFPVALMAGLADIFTVFLGPTHRALKHAPKLVEKFSVGIPKVGSAAGPHGAAGITSIATTGLGDFIFITFFFVAIYRFGLREKPTFWTIFTFLILAMGSVLMIRALPALPLLPFIALAFLLANHGIFHFSGAEKLYMGIAVLVILGLLVAFALLR